MLEKGDIPIEVTENTTISNEYTITLKNEDYTLGNALVYFLYEKYYSGNKTLSFVGFRVPHPHIPEGVIRMAFESVNDATTVSQYLTFAAEDIIKTFTNIQSKFKE
jgi:DNA-directed RNA polymerase subunit L